MLRRDGDCFPEVTGDGGSGAVSSVLKRPQVILPLASKKRRVLVGCLPQVAADLPPLAPVRRLRRAPAPGTRSSRQAKVKIAQKAGQSYLQQCSVRPRTRELYLQAWDLFKSFAKEHDLRLSTPSGMEAALLSYFDHLWAEGQHAACGRKVLTAVMYLHPELATARGGTLQAVRQALRGWGRLTPLRTRLPTPWEVICLLCQELVRRGCWSMAAACLLSVVFYFRPSELLSLRVCQLIRPLKKGHWSHHQWTVILHPRELGQPSKTNQWDDARALDHPDHAFL